MNCNIIILKVEICLWIFLDILVLAMYNNNTIDCSKKIRKEEIMDNTEKNEILVAIAELGTKIDSMQEQVAKIPEIEKQVAKIPEMQKEIEKIPEMQKEIAKISEMQKEIRNISRSVAVIEHEHGDKLKALFDAFTANTEKIGTEEKRISFCERKIESHDTDIYYLKTKVQGL